MSVSELRPDATTPLAIADQLMARVRSELAIGNKVHVVGMLIVESEDGNRYVPFVSDTETEILHFAGSMLAQIAVEDYKAIPAEEST